MKKLLIISLFLVSLLTLFANGPGVPHHAIFDLRTADGGFHEADAIGFMAEEFHTNPMLDDAFFAEEGSRNQLYWNWPDHEDQNTGNTVYVSPDIAAQPGRMAIQMATLYTWGIGGVQARFYFIDGVGNMTGPHNLAKAPGAATYYPGDENGVIAWGGPVAPAFPDWAINPTPATGAMGVAIDVDLTWAYEGEVIPDGYEIVINDEEAVDLGDVLTYTPEVDFDYATLYTWGIMPYVNDAEPARGLRAARSKIYPEGEMPEWTFTTMDEPLPELVWATPVNPLDEAEDVEIELTLEWAYDGPTVDGFEVFFDDAPAVDVIGEMTLELATLEYDQIYEWSVRPYRMIDAPAEPLRGRGLRQDELIREYPEGEMLVWTFITMDEPLPELVWATDPTPADGEGDIEIENVVLEWQYDGDIPVDGFEVFFDSETSVDVIGEMTLELATLDYNTTYTWSVRPYRVIEAPAEPLRGRGTREDELIREYPAGTAPEWTFTTMDEPLPELVWATPVNPLDEAEDVEIELTLEWAYDGPTVDGFEVFFDDAPAVDVTDGMTLELATLEYDEIYEWSVRPYRMVEAPAEPLRGRGLRQDELIREYPAGDMTWWTFITEMAPIPAPSLATLVSPEDGAEGVALDEQLMWSYEGAYIDGFEVVFNGADAVDVLVSVGEEETYSFDPGSLAPLTEYTWTVRPYRVDADPVRGMRAISSRIYPDAAIMTWTFTTTNEADVSVGETEIVIVVPDGGSANAPIPGDDLNPGDPIGDNTVPAGLVYVRFTIDQLPGAYTFRFTLNYASVVVLINNIPYNDYTYTGGVLSLNYTFSDAKAPMDLIVYDESTLPVELSSFTAVAFASEYVTLNWVTESESNLHGYNIFRAENDNINSAVRINASVVVANNQAVTSTYTYRDNEVESTTYYYWLEVSELSNENTFHGPIVVTVEDDPVIPGVATTEFRNFGPSPFSDVTSTTLRVKEGETASITIYNLLGQVVTRETFNAGEHNFTFNGRDANGKRVANGIYFVKMASPTTTKNFKIVKMK